MSKKTKVTPSKSQKRPLSLLPSPKVEDGAEHFDPDEFDAPFPFEEELAHHKQEEDDDEIEEPLSPVVSDYELSEGEDIESGEDDDEEDEDSEDDFSDDVTSETSEGKTSSSSSSSSSFSNIPSSTILEEDTSSEDEKSYGPNRIGNVPLEWYDEYEHIGYDLAGNKVMRPPKRDALDKFLEVNDPSGKQWRSIYDEKQGREILLTPEQYKMVLRIQSGKLPATTAEEEDVLYHMDFQDGDFPLTNKPDRKRSFLHPGWERIMIEKMAHRIRKGRMSLEKKVKPPAKTYDLWESDAITGYGGLPKAPKRPLPEHVESFNPSTEFLWSEKEKEVWKEQEPQDRKIDFIPKAYERMRHLPGYNLLEQNYDRFLDLQKNPRLDPNRKKRKHKKKTSELPSAQSLKPFPSNLSVSMIGHRGRVTSVSASPTGQWLVSGAKDGTVRFWETHTGRCVRTLRLSSSLRSTARRQRQNRPVHSSAEAFLQQQQGGDGDGEHGDGRKTRKEMEEEEDEVGVGNVKTAGRVKINCVAWNPDPQRSVVLVALEDSRLLFVNAEFTNEEKKKKVEEEFLRLPRKESRKWFQFSVPEDTCDGFIPLQVTFAKPVTHVSWHFRGDYFSVVIPFCGKDSVLIGRLTKRELQKPFRRNKSETICSQFHPSKPMFLIGNNNHIKIYHLRKKKLWKKLYPGRQLSTFSVHPGGDNVLFGGFEGHVKWFDLELSRRPHRSFKFHKRAVRKVEFHRKYPLFATAGDDLKAHVLHATVYDDWVTPPLIVPLKVLHGHRLFKGFGVLDLTFHPTQPWLFTAGADGKIFLYTSV